MLARGDSQGIQSLQAASPPPFPAWARAVNAPETDAEAAFLAGAALARLDAIVRQNPAWFGVWRQRLALERRHGKARAAPAGSRTRPLCATRSTCSRPGGDPGPAGRFLLAWRELAARPTRQWRSSLAAAVAVLGVRSRRSAGRCASRGPRPAPPPPDRRRSPWPEFLSCAARPDLGRGAPVAWGPGRGGRARSRPGSPTPCSLERLNWPFALPLLTASVVARAPSSARAPENLRRRRRDDARLVRLCAGAAGAVDLAGELGAAGAEKLEKAAPKLRAKGAGAALQALLDEDCLRRDPPKPAGNCRSAGRGGCSTDWLRLAQSGN